MLTSDVVAVVVAEVIKPAQRVAVIKPRADDQPRDACGGLHEKISSGTSPIPPVRIQTALMSTWGLSPGLFDDPLSRSLLKLVSS